LVKLSYSGVCGSQLMEIFGGRDNKKHLPHMLGHEASGKIVLLGKNVKKFKKKEKVFLSWISPARKNKVNPKYYDIVNDRKINAGKLTTFNNYALVDKDNVYKLGKINQKTGVLLGCAMPTGCGLIENQIKSIKNKKIAIIGLGGVGISALLAILYKKTFSSKVHVFEKNISRIKFLKKKLKDEKIIYLNSDDNNFNKFQNYFDYIVECSGKAQVIEKSMKLIKNNGKVIFASHPNKKYKIKIDPFDLILGKQIIGSWGGQTKFKKNIIFMKKIIRKYKNINNIFFSKEYNLNQINNAIKDMTKGRVIRPLIKMV